MIKPEFKEKGDGRIYSDLVIAFQKFDFLDVLLPRLAQYVCEFSEDGSVEELYWIDWMTGEEVRNVYGWSPVPEVQYHE